MTFIRKLNPRLALPFAAIAVILIAAAAVIAPNLSPPPALAQSNSAAPANVAARDVANTGEVIVSWTPNAAAARNRVGWANISEVRAEQAAGDWLEAFNFVEIGGAKTSYTVKRLEPGTQHAFIVATIAANGAATYSEWVFLTTAAAQAPTPCPTPGAGGQHPTQPGFCPITGIAIPPGGYKVEGDKATWGRFSVTLNGVETPETVSLVASDGTESDEEPPVGRRWLDIKVRVDNDMPWTVTMDDGRDYILGTDTGNGFGWNGSIATGSGYYRSNLGLLFDVPESAEIAVLAIRPLIASSGSDNAPELFRIPIPAP